MTNVIVSKILYPSSVLGRQLHHLALQPPLGSVSGNRLASGTRGGLVVGADPRSQALVGHLAREVAIYGGDELVVQVLALAIVRIQYVVDPLRILGLVQAPCEPTRPWLASDAAMGNVMKRGAGLPIMNWAVASLYAGHWSLGMFCFSAVYIGSRSMRGAML